MNNELFLMIVKQGWEILKGVMPLFVALLTIAINGWREKEKDARARDAEHIKAEVARKKELYLLMKQDLRLIENNVLALTGMVWDVGNNLLDAIQHSDEETDYFSEFYKNQKDMLILARKINGYSDIKFAQYKNKKISFLNMFHTISLYSTSLIDILDSYNEKAEKTPLEHWEKLLDEVQGQLTAASQETEDKLIKYCCLLDEVLQESPYGQFVSGAEKAP